MHDLLILILPKGLTPHGSKLLLFAAPNAACSGCFCSQIAPFVTGVDLAFFLLDLPQQTFNQRFTVCRQAVESKEVLEVAKAREAAADSKHKEADAKLAGLLAREQVVADYKQQHAAAAQATEAADQVCYSTALSNVFLMLICTGGLCLAFCSEPFRCMQGSLNVV